MRHFALNRYKVADGLDAGGEGSRARWVLTRTRVGCCVFVSHGDSVERQDLVDALRAGSMIANGEADAGYLGAVEPQLDMVTAIGEDRYGPEEIKTAVTGRVALELVLIMRHEQIAVRPVEAGLEV